MRIGKFRGRPGTTTPLRCLMNLSGSVARKKNANVVDDAGIVLAASSGCEVSRARSSARLPGHVHLDSCRSRPAPSTRGTGSRAAASPRSRRHLCENSHLVRFEVVRADEEMVQLGDGHGAAPERGSGDIRKDEVHLRFRKCANRRTKKWAYDRMTARRAQTFPPLRASPRASRGCGDSGLQEIFGCHAYQEPSPTVRGRRNLAVRDGV